MSNIDNKLDQQNCTPSHSSATNIQRTLYISLVALILFFTFISAIHFLVNDKTIQTIIQIIAYISGIAIGIILFLIAHNQSKTNHSSGIMMIIFLYFMIPAYLIGIAYFSKIPMDAGAALGYLIPLVYAFYEKLGKSKENDTRENTSAPSPGFIQENSSASIQNNSPISIQNNNNSPISIQNNINTTQNVTNTIDKQSERERTKVDACKMLESGDLASRISAVKTLANLADSWLDDSDPMCKKDKEKCQDIIDILCAYIRSPFLAAERIELHEAHQRLKAIEKFEAALSPHEVPPQYQSVGKRYKQFIDTSIHKEPEDIAAEYAKLHKEQDIRRAIFTTISSRVNRFDKKQGKSIPGLWSGFDFNFRNSKIFYPLNDINIESPDFSGAIFILNANFQGSYFSGKASLTGATFRAKAEFSRAIFNSELDKENSETVGAPERFEEKIITNSTFYKTVFEQEASFTDSMFLQCPEFMNTKLTNGADFADSLFNFNTAKNLRLYSRDMPVGQTSMQSGSPEGFILPLGARLFDPGSWDEEQQKYTRVSEPAKPIEESDNQGENPSK